MIITNDDDDELYWWIIIIIMTMVMVAALVVVLMMSIDDNHFNHNIIILYSLEQLKNNLVLAVNQVYIDIGQDIALNQGDHIAVIPPLSGGWELKQQGILNIKCQFQGVHASTVAPLLTVLGKEYLHLMVWKRTDWGFWGQLGMFLCVCVFVIKL